MGYWLGEAFWSKGIMSQAVRVFLRFVFASFPEIHRVHAVPYGHNAASQRVLQKAGLKLEGIMRCCYLKEGKLLDGPLYAVIRSEWEAQTASEKT